MGAMIGHCDSSMVRKTIAGMAPRMLLVSALCFSGGCGGTTADSNSGGSGGVDTDGSAGGGSAPDGFVLAKEGLTIHSSCEFKEDASFVIDTATCNVNDRTNQTWIQVAGGRGSIAVTFGGQVPGKQMALSQGDGGAQVALDGDCAADSYASVEKCEVELVELKRGEVTWLDASKLDEASSVVMRMTCPEVMVGDLGDDSVETRLGSRRLEFRVSGCWVVRD